MRCYPTLHIASITVSGSIVREGWSGREVDPVLRWFLQWNIQENTDSYQWNSIDAACYCENHMISHEGRWPGNYMRRTKYMWHFPDINLQAWKLVDTIRYYMSSAHQATWVNSSLEILLSPSLILAYLCAFDLIWFENNIYYPKHQTNFAEFISWPVPMRVQFNRQCAKYNSQMVLTDSNWVYLRKLTGFVSWITSVC